MLVHDLEPVTSEPLTEAVVAEPPNESVVVEPAIDAAMPEPVVAPLDDLRFDAIEPAYIPDGSPFEEELLDLSPTDESASDVAADATVAADAASPDVPVEPAVADHRAAAAAATGALLASLRPGQTLDEALDEIEETPEPNMTAPEPIVEAVQAPEVGDAAVELAPEPLAAAVESPVDVPADLLVAEPVLEPVAAAEPVVAEAEREPEPAPIAAAAVLLAVEPEPDVPESVPEPVAAVPEPVAPEPEPVAAVPVEPIATPVVAEPEPAVTAPAPEPVAVAPVKPVVSAPAADVVAQPTWTILAPDPSPTNGAPVMVPPVADPQWPTTPEWPDARPSSQGLPFLGRPAVPTGGVEALWAASDREVTTAPDRDRPVAGVQSCVSCGLSLSATARFCRRCGTAQH
jgi:hypothetical protein